MSQTGEFLDTGVGRCDGRNVSLLFSRLLLDHPDSVPLSSVRKLLYPCGNSSGEYPRRLKGVAMKSIRAHQTGGPEVLVYEDSEEPTPGPGEALVDI